MKSKKRNNNSEIQPLEPRRLMAAVSNAIGVSIVSFAGGQQLRVLGSATNDSITVRQSGSTFTVKSAAGYSKSFTGSYNSIRVYGSDGNDSIAIDATVKVPAYVHGNAGSDTLSGGSADDNLYGGSGNDKLYGNAGRDTLIAFGGGTTDSVTGGAGEDTFWVDSTTTEKLLDASASESKTGVNRVSGFETSQFSSGTRTESVSKEINGQRFRDPAVTSSAYVYKRTDSKPLFAKNGPSSADVRQGQIGDCYFLATLGGAADVSPQSIRGMIADLGDGTYAVRFKTATGQSKFYRVDNDFAVSGTNPSNFAYAKLGQDGATWVAVAEKAYAFHRKGQGTYKSLEAGWMNEVFTALGATGVQSKWSEDTGGSAAFIKWVEDQLSQGKVVTFGVVNYEAGPINLINQHGYQVLRVETLADGTKQLVVRNPWGTDGKRVDDGANDGKVTLTADQAYTAIEGFVAGKTAA